MKLFLFDLDGTLLTTDGAGRAALRLASADVFGVAEDLSNIAIAGNTDSRIGREILTKHGIPVNEATLNRLLGAYLARLVDQLKASPGRILPGVMQVLERVIRAQVGVGLLTGNLRRGADLKLGAHGVKRFFEFGAFGDDDFDRNKLGPIALERAQAWYKTSFAPDDVFVIGDTPRDVACARAFGARAVAVATGQYSSEELAATQPDFLFADLSDIKKVGGRLGF
ncbi:MAG: HAD family hydrolase [Verrucomicrobia bacterium]|nr:HAD family hydrolase [Verrucomicrobiota bacterium]